MVKNYARHHFDKLITLWINRITCFCHGNNSCISAWLQSVSFVRKNFSIGNDLEIGRALVQFIQTVCHQMSFDDDDGGFVRRQVDFAEEPNVAAF